MNDHTLAAEYINAGYNHKTILSDVSVTIPQNKISVILGANGCGKSTLLKTFARLLAPQSGQMILDGKNVSEIPSRQMAKMLGLLPQSPVVPEGIRVMDLVSRGRFPYRQFLKSMTREDYAAVEEAMEIMGITELTDRAVEELSGGQRQRVWIVMVLHDINLSARYADYLFAMKKGQLVAEGTPDEIITPELMEKVYGLACDVITDPVSQSPMVLPKGRHYASAAI